VSNVDPQPKINKANSFVAGFSLLGEARTRILLWYMLLMTFFVAVSIPTIRQQLFSKVEKRVRAELMEEIEEFEQLLTDNWVNEKSLQSSELPPDRNYISKEKQLSAVFDKFMSRQLTEDDTFLIAIVKEKFYKSSSSALPEIIDHNSELMNHWQQLNHTEEGEEKVADPDIGSIIYTAIPIQLEEEILGVLVVTHITEGERKEALEAFRVIVKVMVVVLAIALLVAWIAAGRVLAPLRVLAETTRTISESDLTKRIPINGKGEIAQLAKTFNEMMNRLESSFATQRNFLNDAGHELRTPITIIQGHLELMGDDPQEREETIALVLDELDRMNRLVDDLILLAKAEHPHFLQLEVIDVGLLTQELYTKAQGLANRNWYLDSVAKGKIVADRQRITQALMNLAQNATQYTNQDDVIAIGSTINSNQVRFWVRDTGEGIAPEDRERIFERFTRAANSRRRSEGAGLGLAIVKAIAQSHQGKIELYSKQGTGSTFTLVLPIEGKNFINHESNSDC
jgi:signal transduction histidine kinase